MAKTKTSKTPQPSIYEGKSQAELIAIIETLNNDFATAKEAHAKELKEKDTVISELLEANVSLKSASPSSDLDAETVDVDGEKYAIRKKRFIHGGNTYTNKDVASNKELAAMLVKTGSPILVKIS